MEKKRRSYDLEVIKAALGSVEALAMTSSALRDATALGFDQAGVAETIAGMERRMFYKSITNSPITASGRTSITFQHAG